MEIKSFYTVKELKFMLNQMDDNEKIFVYADDSILYIQLDEIYKYIRKGE